MNLSQVKEVGNAIGRMAEEAKNPVKHVMRAVKIWLIKVGAVALVFITIIIIVCSVFLKIQQVISEIFDTVKSMFSINSSLDERVDEIWEKLEEYQKQHKDIKLKSMGITKDLIKKFIEAEDATLYPDTGSGKNIVKIKRATASSSDARGEALTYVSKEEFQQLVDNNSDSALKKFSLDGDTLLYATYEEVQISVEGGTQDEQDQARDNVGEQEGKRIKSMSVNYKSLIQQYSMPAEFLVTMCLISQNSNYTEALVELIEDGEIDITIQDTKTTTTTVTTYSYTKETETNTRTQYKGDDHRSSTETSTTSEDTTITTTTTKTVNTSQPVVTYVDTWIVKGTYEFTHEQTENTSTQTSDLGSEEWGSYGPAQEKNKENSEDADEIDSITTRERTRITNKQQTVDTTINTDKYVAGPSTMESNEGKFLGLWKNEDGNYKKGAEYDPDGKAVKYKKPGFNLTYEIVEDKFRETTKFLFKMLENNTKTTQLSRVMRYMMYVYTGKDYGVIEFDFNIFNQNNFATANGGIYGGTIEEKVWFSLRNANYSEFAVAGVMGNIYQESRFDPTAIQDGREDTEGWIGIGLIQWTETRKDSLKSYASSQGKSWEDPDVQIQYLLGELQRGGGADGYASWQWQGNTEYEAQWINATSATEAAIAFCKGFERAGDAVMETRTSKAEMYYQEFHGKTMPSGSAENADGNGYSQIYFDSRGRAFKEYKQGWGSYSIKPFYGTIASSGCSLTSVAIILSGYGIDMDPGQVLDHEGISSFSVSGALSNMGISCAYGAKNKDSIKNHLLSGHPVVVHIGDDKWNATNSPYTSQQHWMPVLDISADGNTVYLSNPNAAGPTGWVTIDSLLIDMSDCLYINS